MNIPHQTKPALWGAVGGAIATLIVGFMWGGWVTGGTATGMAAKAADAAVITALAPICVDRFRQEPAASANFIALKAESSYKQAAFIEKGGWATMAGADKPYSGTSKACADLLVKLAPQG